MKTSLATACDDIRGAVMSRAPVCAPVPGKSCRQPGKLRRSRRGTTRQYNQKLLMFQRYNFGTNPAIAPSWLAVDAGCIFRAAEPFELREGADMGIFGAMTTAVSGLTAQSYALENISGNIANSRTVGFKRVDTSFSTLVPDLPLGREVSGSVAAYSRATNAVPGDFQTSQITTSMAISGDGYFPVRARTGMADGSPVFSGAHVYTRRGDFQISENGYLVNGSGFYLEGYPIDPSTGATSGSALQVLRITNDNLPANATTQIEYRGNLPAYPRTANADATIPNSELLTGAAYTGATVAASDDSAFTDRTIAGPSLTVYNSIGTPINVQMRWGKTASSPDTWSLYYKSDSNATGAAPMWTRVTSGITFDNNGHMTAPASGVVSSTFTVNGATSGTVDITFGNTGLTQFADTNGTVNVNQLNQDGYPSGTRTGLSVGEGGRIMGVYSNGRTVALAQIPLARFPADGALKRQDGGVFEETLESGQPIFDDAGRNIIGGSVEGSNADVADEFSKMIVTQQAYSANTRIITTAQQMLQDVMNIIR